MQGEADRALAPSLLPDSGCVARPSLSPVPSVSPPIRIESSSPTVVEGQTLDLNCVVTGQPQATITWYKRGGSLPAQHQVQSGAGTTRAEPLPAGAGIVGTDPTGKELEVKPSVAVSGQSSFLPWVDRGWPQQV